jgi:hypothetical protein
MCQWTCIFLCKFLCVKCQNLQKLCQKYTPKPLPLIHLSRHRHWYSKHKINTLSYKDHQCQGRFMESMAGFPNWQEYTKAWSYTWSHYIFKSGFMKIVILINYCKKSRQNWSREISKISLSCLEDCKSFEGNLHSIEMTEESQTGVSRRNGPRLTATILDALGYTCTTSASASTAQGVVQGIYILLT